MVWEKKILEIHIDKDMKVVQKVTFCGEGDQEPRLKIGDIIVLDQSHAVFTWRWENLFMCRDRQLVEVFYGYCGSQEPKSTLKKKVILTSISGNNAKHRDRRRVLSESLPISC